jgi:hypothetical protein
MRPGEIMVEVADDRLVVTLDGTSYRAFFYKDPDEPRLVQEEFLAVDKAVPIRHEDFEAMAWEAANAKARELGWID